MERIKRPLDEDVIYDYNNNKIQKVENQIITKNSRSHIGNLPNETIFEIFEYLDVYHIYQSFFNYNQRYQNLVLYSTSTIQINISTMSKSNLYLYYKQMILPNYHRIDYLRLSNPFSFDIILSPAGIICQFIQLETLILENFDTKYLNKFFQTLIHLPKLQSLTLSPADYVPIPCVLYSLIFSLPHLKSCKLSYQVKPNQETAPIGMIDFKLSPIEYLTINHRFSFDSLSELFRCVPKLRYLSIDSIVGSDFADLGQHRVLLKNLKYLSMKLERIDSYLFKMMFRYYFYYIENLHITVENDWTYLDAKQLEKLIRIYIPNLRVFDIHYTGPVLKYHDLINQFNSPFWIDKNWFFTRQQDPVNNEIFYSTSPYQRNNYKFYWQSNQHIQENFSSVKHVHIYGQQVTNHFQIYFPNATELTIEHYFKTAGESIRSTLNHILPLKQITTLNLRPYNFPFEQILILLCFTPNLHTLKFTVLPYLPSDVTLAEQRPHYQSVSKTNKIKNLEVRGSCSILNLPMLMKLFPQVEYLKTRMMRREVHQMIRFLFSKSNHIQHRLLFLCISEIPKVCLKELKNLIEIENLLKDYSIKYIKRDLYLWW